MAHATDVLEVDEERQFVRASYSAITAHRTCANLWMYRYHLGLKLPEFTPSPERIFGSWWGAITAGEALERGRRLESLRAEPRPFRAIDADKKEAEKLYDPNTVTANEVFLDAVAYWKTRDPETQARFVETFGETLPKRLKALFHAWMEEFAEQRKHERPLGLEVRWERRLEFPRDEDTPADMPDIRLVGYIDEAYFDDERGFVVVRDRKSHKVLPQASALDDMMDSQLPLYTWGASELIATWGHGAPRAVGYDRARTVAPKSPALSKTTGALSKSVTDYDLATYLRWARTDTRPTERIAAWLEERRIGFESGAEIPDEEKIAYVRDLPAGQFWSNTKEGEDPLAFLVSGARRGKPKFGVYEEEPKVIEKLSTPLARAIWFQRTRKPLNRNVVREHLRAAADTAMDAWRTRRRAIRSGSGARSLGKHCGWCDYDALCRAQMMGGSEGEYDLREFGLIAPEGKNMITNGELIVGAPWTTPEMQEA